MAILIDIIRNLGLVCFRYFRLSVIPILLIIALFFYLRSDKRQKFIGFIYPLTVLILVLNPLTYYLVRKLVDFDSYIRVFWIAFIPIILSLFVTDLVSGNMSKPIKALILIVLSFSLFFTGKLAYLSGDFERAENPYKLSQSVIEASDAIVRDAAGKDICVLNIPEFGYQSRQYEPSIKLIQAARPYFQLNTVNHQASVLIQAIDHETVDLGLVSDSLTQSNINYLVIRPEQDIIDCQNIDTTVIYLSNDYAVYRVSHDIMERIND